MRENESNPAVQAKIESVEVLPDMGWAITYSDETCRILRQDPRIIEHRIEQLDTPVVQRRRGHKLAGVAACLLAAETILIGGSIIQHDGNIVDGLDAAATLQIGVFFDSLDGVSDIVK